MVLPCTCPTVVGLPDEAQSPIPQKRSRSMTIARFRANPEKVRVAVRRVGDEWEATVSIRDNPHRVLKASSMYPERAVLTALRLAAKWEGVDLDMQWAYDHPQQPE